MMQYRDLPYTPDPDLPEDLVKRVIESDLNPHCDANVLHAPGECRFCDGRPDLQIHRLRYRIAFTGHPAPDGGKPCWSDTRRGLGGAHVWGGNRPTG